MKCGYSILLGETIEAAIVQYRDCERFQIVCPHCREPVFKSMRVANAMREAVHYLSHYSANVAYQAECDLRVSGLDKAAIESRNRASRDQRLAYFLSVLQRTLGRSPIYAVTAEESHRKLNGAPALRELRDRVWAEVVIPNRKQLFEEGVEAYLWTLQKGRWALVTSFSLEIQRRIAQDMWLTITTSAGRSNFDYLFNHAWLEQAGILIRGIRRHTEHKTRQLQAAQLLAMERILTARRGEVASVLRNDALETTFRDLPMKYRRQRTADAPTDVLSRMVGNHLVEMIGVLMEVPYFELLKQQYGDDGKVYPFIKGIEQMDSLEAARIAEWRTRGGASSA